MIGILPNPKKHINERFHELIYNKDRFLCVYGGRGSGKSANMARIYVYRCLIDKYFKCLIIRKTYNNVRNSIYDEIKAAIYELGFEELFTFNVSPLQITCVNGNMFLGRGLDDPTKIKSVKDPSHALFEEANQITEEDFITVTTSIRTSKNDYLQEVLLFNPEADGDYKDFWIYKTFFENSTKQSFAGAIQYENASLPFTVHHSTYKDNPFVDSSFKAILENLKHQNEYYYNVFTLGNWGNRSLSGLFYYNFSMKQNVINRQYDDTKPLHISYDFNSLPYVTITIWQIFDGVPIQINEILSAPPKNNTRLATLEFCKTYPRHYQKIYIYGDPSGRANDTRTEIGVNDFTIIRANLETFYAVSDIEMKVRPFADLVKQRGMFINSLFLDKKMYIAESCKNTLSEYLSVQENQDGAKLKKKVKNEDGQSFEQFGHISDANDYFIMTYYQQEYKEFINPANKTVKQKQIVRQNKERAI